jgi:hypothetical protein
MIDLDVLNLPGYGESLWHVSFSGSVLRGALLVCEGAVDERETEDDATPFAAPVQHNQLHLATDDVLPGIWLFATQSHLGQYTEMCWVNPPVGSKAGGSTSCDPAKRKRVAAD